MAEPVKVKIFHPTDLFFIGMFILSLVWAIVFPPQGNKDIPKIVASIISWSVVIGFLVITIFIYVLRFAAKSNLKFQYRGIVVSWNDNRFSVKEKDFESIIDLYFSMLEPKYSNLSKALKGCIVVFQEPKILAPTLSPITKLVAGYQDGQFIYVGWHENLGESALMHELTHRVFQIFEGDPPQDKAHKMMEELGV